MSEEKKTTEEAVEETTVEATPEAATETPATEEKAVEEKKAEEKSDEKSEEKKDEKSEEKQEAPAKNDRRSNNRRGGRGGDRKGGKRRGRRDQKDKPQDEFESIIVDLARVTRVMGGGKRMSFRACVLVGDKKGRVGMGVKKGADVQMAVQKATNYAKKRLITVPTVDGTIPHVVEKKFKGAQVLLKPAKEGTGIIAGGPVRIVMEQAGVRNIVSKMKGSSNKVNNVTAVIEALKELTTKEDLNKMRS